MKRTRKINLKKNRMMRLASSLVVLTIVTTSIISGIFASFSTEDGANDSARAANWGVSLQVVGNLFGDTYHDTIVAQNADNVSVQSSDLSSDLVAPGTKSEDNAFAITLTGTPETDGKITTTIEAENIFLKAGHYGVIIKVADNMVTEDNFSEFSDLYVKNGDNYVKAITWSNTDFYTLEDYVNVTDDYYPVVFDLSGATSTTGAITGDSLNLAAAALAKSFNGSAVTASTSGYKSTYTTTRTFNTNDDLSDWNLSNETLKWTWSFIDSGNAVGDSASMTDKADTILGNLYAGNGVTVVRADTEDGTYSVADASTDYNLTVSFNVNVVASQVD